MYTEEIRISVIPGAMCNIINISQYDVGVRSFHFVPYTTEGDLAYQAGCAVTLEATKPDRSAIIHNCTYNNDGSIDYTLQEQLAAVAGRVWSKLVLRDTLGGILGTAAIVWVVDRAGVTDGAEMSDSDISAVQEFIQEFGSINAYGAALHGLMAAYGGPLTANAAAGMTDQTKVYVYTGTTTSALTNGHWYYYDGSSWADGGVYQAAAVQTDTTLTVAGEAADAKATGDKITELKNDFDHALRTEVDLTGDYITDKYIDLLVSIGATVDTTLLDTTAFKCQIVKVFAGDRFVISGGGGNRERLYGITDNDYKLIYKTASQYIVENENIEIESDGYLISNVRKTIAHSLVENKITTISDALNVFLASEGDAWED